MPDVAPAASAGGERVLHLALGACLLVLVGIAFAPALRAEFLNFDDDKLFTLNHRWRGLDAEHVGWMLTTGLMGHWQPLTWLTFGVDHALHGLTPPSHPEAGAYHATSLVLHGLTVLALYWLGLRLFAITLPRLDDRRRTLAAAGAAALWAVHPLRVESVVWLTERRDVLSALFAVLAVRLWLDWAEVGRVPARTRGATLAVVGSSFVAVTSLLLGLDLSTPITLRVASWPLLGAGVGAWLASIAATARGSGRAPAFALACACLGLSLGAKAWAMVLPAVLVVLDVWPLRRVQRGRLTALVVEKLPLVVPALVCARLAHWAQAGGVGVMTTWTEHGLQARVAQAFYGLVYYPVRSLVPIDLLPIYELPPDLRLLEPRWLVPALAAIAVALALLALRRRAPAAVAAFVTYAILVSPVLGFVQSGPQLVADRYAHIATMPLALLVAGTAAWLSASHAAAVGAAAGVVLVASVVATWRQTTVWQTSTSLFEHAYAIDPDNAAVLTSLGVLRAQAAERERDPALALALLRDADGLHQRAFALDDDPQSLMNLSQVHTLMSFRDPQNRQRYLLESADFSRRALELARSRNAATPDFVLSHGTDLVNVGRLDEGIALLRWYVEVEPERLRGLLNLGGALTMAGKGGEALPFLERACRLEPNDPRAWTGLARAQQAIGQRDAALASWRRALALAPGDAGVAQQIRALEAAP